MIYVGNDGILAAYYAAVVGCFPEVAFAKIYGEVDLRGKNCLISTEERYQMIEIVEQVMPEWTSVDKGALIGFDKLTYNQYKSRLKRSKKGE